MTAQELATALVNRYAHVCRATLARPARDFGDPFDNGMFLVILVAVEAAFGFTEREAMSFIRMTVGEV